MDFQRYSIDERLAQAAEGLGVRAVFYEKMIEYAVEKSENVCAKINLSEGTEAVCVLPALQWLASGPAAAPKILVLAPDAETARKAWSAAASLGAGIGASACLVLEGEAADLPAIEGEPGASLVAGTPAALLAAAGAGSLSLRDYGFLVALGAERLADASPEPMRRLAGSLLPSWERRAVLACAKISAKAKNLAWDLADNPSEIQIEEEAANVQGLSLETWSVAGGSKFRFLLGLIGREKRDCLCVFCNLRGTAEEVARRLAANGLPAKAIAGPLPPERQFALLENAKAGGGQVLVLTDEGAVGLTPGSFPLVVNYDVPLEAEYFIRRLEFLDRAAPGAKIVSLACERYLIGLTAIERLISGKLETLPADESLLAAEDRSEGASAGGRPRREDARREDTRRGGPPGEPRSRGREDARLRDDARNRPEGRRGDGRGGDRSPDIRRSIAEATGGSLDMSGDSLRPEPRREDTRREDTRREGGRRGQGGSGEGRKREGQRRAEGRRGGSPGNKPRREDTRREDTRRGQGGAQGRPAGGGNPYELSMEERMRLYREKYGQRLAAEGSGDAGRPSGPGHRARREDARREDTRREDTRREQPQAPSSRPGEGGAAPGPKEGLFRKLFGSRARDED